MWHSCPYGKLLFLLSLNRHPSKNNKGFPHVSRRTVGSRIFNIRAQHHCYAVTTIVSNYQSMKQNTILIACLSFFVNCHSSKSNEKINIDYYDKCRELVLGEGVVGQEYLFKVSGKTIDEMTVIYLGEMQTKESKVLKFIISTNYTGLQEDSRRASSSVFIYDNNGSRLGSYYVGSVNSLPDKLDSGYLLFAYNNETCNQSTRISFIDSIPKNIFIRCTITGGDLYTFKTE
jgi:hypothetical protein